jgi:hypothetical protein
MYASPIEELKYIPYAIPPLLKIGLAAVPNPT